MIDLRDAVVLLSALSAALAALLAWRERVWGRRVAHLVAALVVERALPGTRRHLHVVRDDPPDDAA